MYVIEWREKNRVKIVVACGEIFSTRVKGRDANESSSFSAHFAMPNVRYLPIIISGWNVKYVVTIGVEKKKTHDGIKSRLKLKQSRTNTGNRLAEYYNCPH